MENICEVPLHPNVWKDGPVGVKLQLKPRASQADQLFLTPIIDHLNIYYEQGLTFWFSVMAMVEVQVGGNPGYSPLLHRV